MNTVQRRQYLWNNDLRVSAVSPFYPRSSPLSHFPSSWQLWELTSGATSLSVAIADWSRFLFFFFFSFLMRTIFEVFVEFVTILVLFHIVIFWPQGMWDLGSPSRDGTWTPCIGRRSLNHWTTRDVPVVQIHLAISWANSSSFPETSTGEVERDDCVFEA